MTGVEALDVDRTRIDGIVLAPRGDAMLEYSMWDGSRPDDESLWWARRASVMC